MTPPAALEIHPVPGFPQLDAPCALGPLVAGVLARAGLTPRQGDLLVVAHKIVSKAEGHVVALATVTPSPNALALAEATGKDPRLVEVILSQSVRVVRQVRGVLICENHLGLICANAGVDRSNAGPERAVMLPKDPDASARALGAALRQAFGIQVPVLIADTHGRPWREGAVGLCIGLWGMDPFTDYRGRQDLYGYEMQSEIECAADELCAAATLVMGQAQEGVPLALVRGFRASALPSASGRALLRPAERDLFR